MDAFLLVGTDEIELTVSEGGECCGRELQSEVFFGVSNPRTFARNKLRDWGYHPHGSWQKHDENTWWLAVFR